MKSLQNRKPMGIVEVEVVFAHIRWEEKYSRPLYSCWNLWRMLLLVGEPAKKVSRTSSLTFIFSSFHLPTCVRVKPGVNLISTEGGGAKGAS